MQLRMVAVLALAPSIARADEAFDEMLHWQIEPAFRFGPVRLDGQTVGFIGGALDLGVRFRRFALVADLAEMSVEAETAPALTIAQGVAMPGLVAGSGGTMDRFGMTGRYYFTRMVDHDVLGDAWVGLGVGREVFEWDVGGTLARTDLLLAIGGTFGGHQDFRRDERRWWMGTSFVLNVIYARRGDGLQPFACGGPCDVATRPSGFDRTIAVDWSFPFGK